MAEINKSEFEICFIFTYDVFTIINWHLLACDGGLSYLLDLSFFVGRIITCSSMYFLDFSINPLIEWMEENRIVWGCCWFSCSEGGWINTSRLWHLVWESSIKDNQNPEYLKNHNYQNLVWKCLLSRFSWESISFSVVLIRAWWKLWKPLIFSIIHICDIFFNGFYILYLFQ